MTLDDREQNSDNRTWTQNKLSSEMLKIIFLPKFDYSNTHPSYYGCVSPAKSRYDTYCDTEATMRYIS